jgi:DNA-binding NtrC family response regulator
MPKELPQEDAILEALKTSRGVQRVAADKLGMSQSWLARWLKENGYVQVTTWVKEKAQ